MKKRNEENYVKHTYKFYKDRKNDPKWRPSYLKARQQRIIWIIIGIAFILLISSISFFAYSYSNAGKHTPTESFNKSSNQSSSTSKISSSSKSSSSSYQEALKNMDNLDLNKKIAILSQAYAALNPSTTILQASNLAMSNSWDNGPIEWYDNQGEKHKLDVRVTGDTITYSYVDPNTGQPTTQTASVNESLDRFYSLKSNMESTQAIANKCVAPADLKPNGVLHDGGHVPEGKGGGFAGPEGYVYSKIVGKGFRYSLIKYDGVDVDTAMKNGAPQNLAHDSTFYFYFVDTNNVESTAVGGYNPKYNHTYEVNMSSIVLSSTLQVPLKLHEGVLHIETTFEKTDDGHTYTYSFTEDSTAKNYIESKK